MFQRFNINARGKANQFEHLTDEDIINIYKLEHNIDCIGELFERYTHLVFGLCMKYLKNEFEAEDATLQIFEDLFDKLENNEISNFKSWLYSVAKNHCLMYLRKQKTENKRIENYYKKNLDYDVDFLPEIHLSNADNDENMVIKLKEAVNNLNDEQKNCIQYMYFENKSYSDISESTGYSLKQVKSHIQNGKRNLKNFLDNKK